VVCAKKWYLFLLRIIIIMAYHLCAQRWLFLRPSTPTSMFTVTFYCMLYISFLEV
jgi:hypothetical protein